MLDGATWKLLNDSLIENRWVSRHLLFIWPLGVKGVSELGDMIDEILYALVFIVMNQKCTVHIIIISYKFAGHVKRQSALGTSENSISLALIIRDIVLLFLSFFLVLSALWVCPFEFIRLCTALRHLRNPSTWRHMNFHWCNWFILLLMSVW